MDVVKGECASWLLSSVGDEMPNYPACDSGITFRAVWSQGQVHRGHCRTSLGQWKKSRKFEGV
jgi:hypothetical protein